MEISIIQTIDSLTVIKLSGVYDIGEIFRFEKFFSDNIKSDTKVVALDFSSLVFIDSSAISSLIRLKNNSKKRSIDLIIVDMGDEVLNVFRLAYLDKFFTIIPRNELLKYIDERAG
jgi:anti-anti-sigma factor